MCLCVQYQYQLSFFCSISSVYFCLVSSHQCACTLHTSICPHSIVFIALEQYFKIDKIINKYKINIHTHTHYKCTSFYSISMRLFLRVGAIIMLYLVVLVILSRLYAMPCYWFSLLSSYSLITTDCYLFLRIYFVLSYVQYTIILRKKHTHTPLEYRLYCGIKYKYRMLCVSVVYTTCVLSHIHIHMQSSVQIYIHIYYVNQYV